MSPEKGKKMPQTQEQYERMAFLCEQALLREAGENSILRVQINEMRQKVAAMSQKAAGYANDTDDDELEKQWLEFAVRLDRIANRD